MKLLLAATDLSAPSRHASQRAALLARQGGARMELMHVLERRALDALRRLFDAETDALQARLRDEHRSALVRMAREVGESAGVDIEPTLLEGDVLEASIAHADSRGVDLMVVGSRGESFMRHWLLGATAERLLHKVRRPLLVVKQPPHEAYRSVLVAVDFSEWSMAALRMARAVAPQARLALLHAVELPFEGKMRVAGVDETSIRQHVDDARRVAQGRLRDLVAAAGIPAERCLAVVAHGAAAPRILEQEEEMGADLIVLGKHGMGMVEELLLGSATKHVLSQSRCDVLVVPR